jgi:protein involved in polysaccharide export with SLBB domain
LVPALSIQELDQPLVNRHYSRRVAFEPPDGLSDVKSVLTALLVAVLLSGATALDAFAQVPPPSQAQAALQQALQQQPGLGEALRSRIRESGLNAEQIRARLRASGYPTTLLDPYLGEATPGAAPVPGAQELAAIQALGLPPATGQVLTLDTGLVRTVSRPSSEVFGVDVFRRSTTQFLPLLAGPVPPDYKLGPGDNLVLILTGDVELAYPLQVTREGFMLIPQVGQVHTANLSLDQLRDLLYSRLGRVYSGVRRVNPTTQFDITVASVRANQVYAVGEVEQPGAYQISSLGTVLTALYAGGGVTERANLRHIEVQRLGKTAATLDLYDYLLAGDTRNDIRLETGDVVFVPVHGRRARVAGAVVRPAIYELKEGDSLADLIRAAGGFRPEAARERLKVERVLPAVQRKTQPTANVMIDVPLVGGAPPPFALEDGDVVHVDSLADATEQYFVTIAGMVQQTGRYPWRPGMTLRELMVLARGPRVGADLREAEIARLPPDRSGGQLASTVRVSLDSTYLFARDSAGRYVGPPGVPFPGPGTAAEVPLEPFDNVLILRQPDFELQRTVEISGEVMYPGTYALRAKDDRLSLLIQRAGGLTPRAYPEGIRFVRTQDNAGRININLPLALRDTASRDNVILQPGDDVHVPEYQPSVRVGGAVNSPGSVLYRRGAAGGFNRLAEKGQVSVRQANGEVRTRHKTLLFFRSDPSPGPGSEVLVPARDPSATRTDVAVLFGAVAQVLASMVAIVYVVTR